VQQAEGQEGQGRTGNDIVRHDLESIGVAWEDATTDAMHGVTVRPNVSLTG